MPQPEDVVRSEEFTANAFSYNVPPMTPQEKEWVSRFNAQLSMDRDGEVACDCTIEVLSVAFDNPSDVDSQLWIDLQSDDPNCPLFFIAGNNRFPNCNYFPNNPCVEHDPMTATAIKDDGTQQFTDFVFPGDILTTRVQHQKYDPATTCGLALNSTVGELSVTLRVTCETTDTDGDPTEIPGCNEGTPPTFPGPQPTPNNVVTITIDPNVGSPGNVSYGRFALDDCCRPAWIQQ